MIIIIIIITVSHNIIICSTPVLLQKVSPELFRSRLVFFWAGRSAQRISRLYVTARSGIRATIIYNCVCHAAIASVLYRYFNKYIYLYIFFFLHNYLSSRSSYLAEFRFSFHFSASPRVPFFSFFRKINIFIHVSPVHDDNNIDFAMIRFIRKE